MNHQIATNTFCAFKILVIYFLFMVIAPTVLNQALAAESCYMEDFLPAISKLDETENGIKVTLDGFYVKISGRLYSSKYRREVPVIYWNEKEGWMSKSEDPCLSCSTDQANELKRVIPHIDPVPVEGMEAEEAPSVPFNYGGHIWFGFDFYSGEGSTGTGGIGRFTPATKHLEVRRPAELKHVPIQKVVHDGEYLWAGTRYNFECSGTPPALGLIKYDWSNQTLSQFTSVNEGPCGFVINDIVWKNGSLWVATDIGLSRWIKSENKWLHYLPDKNNPSQVSTMSCPDIYSFLFKEFTKTRTWCDAGNSCDVVLLNNLKQFRPDYYESIKDDDHIKQQQ